jgi:hypothetical protein
MGCRHIPSKHEECRQIAASIRRILVAKYINDEKKAAQMTTSPLSTRRLILAGGFALAIAIAPAAAIVAQPSHATDSKPMAACDTGEEEDVFTTSCTPFLVPNSPQGFTTTAANPDVPEIEGVPCTGGRSSGACIGLAEDEAAAGPQPVPRSTISSSP